MTDTENCYSKSVSLRIRDLGYHSSRHILKPARPIFAYFQVDIWANGIDRYSGVELSDFAWRLLSGDSREWVQRIWRCHNLSTTYRIRESIGGRIRARIVLCVIGVKDVPNFGERAPQSNGPADTIAVCLHRWLVKRVEFPGVRCPVAKRLIANVGECRGMRDFSRPLKGINSRTGAPCRARGHTSSVCGGDHGETSAGSSIRSRKYNDRKTEVILCKAARL
jgi:hypothetical protein